MDGDISERKELSEIRCWQNNRIFDAVSENWENARTILLTISRKQKEILCWQTNRIFGAVSDLEKNATLQTNLFLTQPEHEGRIQEARGTSINFQF